MGIDTTDAFIVIRWPEAAGLPRYSFVTPPHLREVPNEVLRVDVLRRETRVRYLIVERETRTRIQSSHDGRGFIDPGAASNLLDLARHFT